MTKCTISKTTAVLPTESGSEMAFDTMEGLMGETGQRRVGGRRVRKVRGTGQEGVVRQLSRASTCGGAGIGLSRYRQFSALDTSGCLGRFTKPYRAMIVFHHHHHQHKVREDIRDVRGNFRRIALAHGTVHESTTECSDLKNTPACSHMKTSSLVAPKGPVSWECCSSNFSLRRNLRHPGHLESTMQLNANVRNDVRAIVMLSGGTSMST